MFVSSKMHVRVDPDHLEQLLSKGTEDKCDVLRLVTMQWESDTMKTNNDYWKFIM